MTYTYSCVYSASPPSDGQRNCPKHVEFYSKNKFEKLVHLVGFITSIYRDARSSECHIQRWEMSLEEFWISNKWIVLKDESIFAERLRNIDKFCRPICFFSSIPYIHLIHFDPFKSICLRIPQDAVSYCPIILQASLPSTRKELFHFTSDGLSDQKIRCK